MTTFQNYIHRALATAKYSYDEETKSWVGEIEDLPLCWAQGETVEEAREELAETVEGWVLLALRKGDPIPSLNGVSPFHDVNPKLAFNA